MPCSPAPRRRTLPHDNDDAAAPKERPGSQAGYAQPVTLARISHAVVLAAGWRRAGIAFLAGAASALAVAPFDAWPVLFLTFPVLVWLVDGSAAGRFSGAWNAAIAGWCFGFGYFVAGLYWIGYAFLVDAKTFGWLLPIAVTGLPAYLALYTGLGLAVARLMWVRGPVRLLALAVALTAAEWLRGHLLTGFPWNTFGYALTEPLALAQSVSLIGVWGLTFLAVAIFATPAVVTDDPADTPHPYRAPVWRWCCSPPCSATASARLATHPTDYVANVKLRIMQPNLQQDEALQLRRQERGHGALSEAVGSRHRSAIERRARRHRADLAGSGVSLLPHPRAGRAGADRRAASSRIPN